MLRTEQSDGDLLSPKGLANGLNASNTELLNRPGKGVTMLSGSVFNGLTAIQYAEANPERNGLSQIHFVEEVVQAAKLLQEAQHSVSAPEDIKASVLTLLQYVAEPSTLEAWRTILGAHLYITGQQVLQVPRPSPVCLCVTVSK